MHYLIAGPTMKGGYFVTRVHAGRGLGRGVWKYSPAAAERCAERMRRNDGFTTKAIRYLDTREPGVIVMFRVAKKRGLKDNKETGWIVLPNRFETREEAVRYIWKATAQAEPLSVMLKKFDPSEPGRTAKWFSVDGKTKWKFYPEVQ